MKISVSNIAWTPEQDGAVYRMMREYGFEGLEIAPTRVFPGGPYDRLPEAKAFAEGLRSQYGFVIPSMQSIWFGRTEKLFGTAEERERLVEYTKKAIDFAETVGCGNLVFGCPRSRILPKGADASAAIPFFREIGEYAKAHRTVIAMEANPPVYGTNYINTTAEAFRLIREVDSEGFLLNLDTGTMIENEENVSALKGSETLIHHVHISEPGLGPVKNHPLHRELAEFLRGFGYTGFVSLETGRCEDPEELRPMLAYLAEVFH